MTSVASDSIKSNASMTSNNNAFNSMNSNKSNAKMSVE